mgnify:CR=1 FL=1
MSDLIDRKAAIEDIAEWIYYEPNMHGKMMGYGISDWEWWIENVLSDLPSVQPERKKGKWIGNPRHQACSECRITYCIPDGQDGTLDMTFYNYCPNCGADMRGRQDE